jgi:hypothetical protein
LKQLALCLLFATAFAPCGAQGQSSSSSLNSSDFDSTPDGGSTRPTLSNKIANLSPASRVGFGVAMSPLGIGFQAATNITNHLNVRGSGNFFNYNTTFNTNGFAATAKLNLASAGATLDYYPFHAGFRLSPGMLFYNGNQLTATTAVAPGTSFTLNHQTYYSANPSTVSGATPASGSAALGLNSTKPAFTMTTGWGNMVPHKGWPISFPFEIGAAFTGAPSLNASLGGWACLDQAQTQCSNLAGTSTIATQVQSAFSAQIGKWTSDLSVLKAYPILSVGLAYSFKIRE